MYLSNWTPTTLDRNSQTEPYDGGVARPLTALAAVIAIAAATVLTCHLVRGTVCLAQLVAGSC